MKQKKHNDKRQNTLTTRNKRTASSNTAYKRIQLGPKDYQKSNYDNQTDNKDNNRVTDMSEGLVEEKKLKTKAMDQKEDNPASPKEAVTSSSQPLSTSSPLSPLQSEVFDSSRDNGMSEMKEVADMDPDKTSNVFSHVEGKQQLDPSNTSINGDIKNIGPEINPNTNTDPTTFPTMVDSVLQERDPSTRELIEEDIMPTQDVKLDDITQVNKESEKRDHLDEYSNTPNIDNNIHSLLE